MKAKQFKKRKDVPKKYTWDLEDLLKGKTIEEYIKDFETYSKKLIKVKDSKYESSDAYLKAMKIEDKQIQTMYIIHNYISNNINADIANPKFNSLYQDFQFKQHNISMELGPEQPRIFKNEKKLKEWVKLPSFKKYKREILSALETKKHQLPKQIQEYLVEADRGTQKVSEVFSILTDAELDYGYATSSKGKKIKITRANRTKLAENIDPKIRKTAAIEYRKAYLKHKKSLSNMLYQHFKTATVDAKLTKHKNVIEYLVFDDRASEKLLTSLYQSVQNNLDVFKSYKTLHSKIYKAKFGNAITDDDWYVPLVKVKTSYTVEEMQKAVLNAFKPFGKEYTDQVRKAFKDRWIDYMAIDNKRSGAYSIGATYGIDKKYILMNNTGDMRATETLAHELGHSMHSYYSDKNNTLRDSGYKIFVAEIASIFNELMLFDHLLKTSTNDRLKFKIRQQMAVGFEATVHRQIVWSNYEYDMYKAIEAGQPVSTYDAISKVYFENSKKYSLKKVPKFDANKQWPSVMVPHYYYGFYVYKYAIGQLVANIFFQRYKENGPKALQDYIKNFLSVGGSMTPLETLKNAGVDLEDPETYKIGYKAARNNVVELKKLAKKLFKI